MTAAEPGAGLGAAEQFVAAALAAYRTGRTDDADPAGAGTTHEAGRRRSEQ
jgi:hypothetical protein